MSTDSKAQLLPCPFCGGKAEAKKPDASYEFTLIKCQECDAQTDERIDFADAAEAWNRRAPSLPDQSIIEAVDGWFARNTGLGGCSDKDVAELAAIFAAAPKPAQVPEGWKIVPEEPTTEMWEAVNKLDDEMAAGGSEHGCTIEQAWHCLYDAAPQPPDGLMRENPVTKQGEE